ncbi:16S rRNA (cytosine(1402)-N(4))-methyltransferase RsmH [Candidatus Saccharibacteria bacterium]|nr:16S rRNA (cytosine(1402)-N(4))-methyltransferase RsmH [Candidatus Saccharibacteria bacterium]
MKNTNKNNQQIHKPVLIEEVLHYLNPKNGDSYLDLTAGYGGHASRILEQTKALEKAILVDRDQTAVKYLNTKLKGVDRIVNSDFFSISDQLKKSGSKFDMILADLGVSSLHLDSASRGFSIMQDGPLDMRMDQTQLLTAQVVVNEYSEEQLIHILRTFGEEPNAKKIAKTIINNRPIDSTLKLAKVVANVTKSSIKGRSRIHPATLTFQAIRMEVNDEIHLLKESLPIWFDLLAADGRIVVISFHSLEDRVVKQVLNEYSGERYDATLKIQTRKPVVCSPEELVINPRARSAKLRAAVKINTKRKE